jgi:hypothetical protein
MDFFNEIFISDTERVEKISIKIDDFKWELAAGRDGGLRVAQRLHKFPAGLIHAVGVLMSGLPDGIFFKPKILIWVNF